MKDTHYRSTVEDIYIMHVAAKNIQSTVNHIFPQPISLNSNIQQTNILKQPII